MCNKIKHWYDKIVITIVPSYTRRNITRLLALELLPVLRTHNNTEGNKLMIFSGIALYHGHTCMVYIHTYNLQFTLNCFNSGSPLASLTYLLHAQVVITKSYTIQINNQNNASKAKKQTHGSHSTSHNPTYMKYGGILGYSSITDNTFGDVLTYEIIYLLECFQTLVH